MIKLGSPEILKKRQRGLKKGDDLKEALPQLVQSNGFVLGCGLEESF